MWSLSHRISSKARVSVKRKYLLAWRDEVGTAIQLREIELKLFRDAEMQPELPKLVMNLVFTSTDQDAATRKSIQRAARPTPGFVNSAFASVEEVVDCTRGRVQHMKVLHMEARQAIAKKIVQRTFLRWKRVHLENKRVGLDAQLCIKRAVRMAFGSRPVWAGEKLMLIFGIWSRWATYSRCKRSGLPLPHYSQALPQWDIWVHNYQERQIRKVKATAKAPLASMRRSFHQLRSFSNRSIEKRNHMEIATQHYVAKVTREILLSWREEIAEGANNKKICRFAMSKLRSYAKVKATLRPRKQAVQRSKQLGDFGRAWRAWKGVHLRSLFKRELNVSRLEQSQWRSKVCRIVYTWMDAKHQVNRWKTFEAWKNYCKKRRLFQTLRFQCERIQKRHLLFGILTAWKAFVWKRGDAFMEDRLRLSAWDAYEELSPLFPMLFYGCYSDAAAIFGGVETEIEEDDSETDDLDSEQVLAAKLPYQSEGIRQFQSIVVQGSVAEVRNTVLRSNHLVNAVDEASGNTPLHVVMNVEDCTRRIDVLSLLLSEGAVTWNRPNRHGLTPTQLTSDEDTQRLLNKGIYEFYATKVRRMETDKAARCDAEVAHSTTGSDQRLMWCMITLMSSEWVRGVRIAGDIKIREWHSVLKEELWLRQERMIFASTSEFSPAILRCRAFLSGMKKKLTRSTHQILRQQIKKALHPVLPTLSSDDAPQDTAQPSPVRRTLSRALRSRGSFKSQQHVGMLTRIVDANDSEMLAKPSQEEAGRNLRAKLLGELEPYARFLLSPTLDCDLAEKALVHSFVGVLFALEVTADDVLDEVFRLEDMCASIEHRMSTLHDLLVRAQWQVRSLAASSSAPTDPSLLCCFSNEADMEFFFEKEIFLLTLDKFLLERGTSAPAASNSMRETTPSDVDDLHERESLTQKGGGLLTKLQRKMRKIEKKKKSLEEQLVDLESQHRAVLFSASRTLRDISATRFVLEKTRLRLAALLLKRSELQSAIAEVETIKRHLQSGDLGDLSQSTDLDTVALVAERKQSLETELSKCTQLYRTKELFALNDNSNESDSTCLEIRRLYKEAKSALRLLFIANLFRCSCCWLAENMAPSVPDDIEDEEEEAQVVWHEEQQDRPQHLVQRRESAVMRRRSSVNSARKLLETPHRGSIIAEAVDVNFMKESYASSAGLLFETERTAMHELEKQRQKQESGIVHTIQELNPMTGQPEEPPEHLLDGSMGFPGAILNTSPRSKSNSSSKTQVHTPIRNRKREELRKAIVLHQLKRIAPGYATSDDRDDGTDNDEASLNGSSGEHSQLPSIHGMTVEFGNFVTNSALRATEDLTPDPTAPSPMSGDRSNVAANPERSAEFMWKPGAKSSTAAASPHKSSSDIFTSAEDESAFTASFRVLSASRDRRPSSRQQSAGTTPKTPLAQCIQSGIEEEPQAVRKKSHARPSSTPLAALVVHPSSTRDHSITDDTPPEAVSDLPEVANDDDDDDVGALVSAVQEDEATNDAGERGESSGSIVAGEDTISDQQVESALPTNPDDTLRGSAPHETAPTQSALSQTGRSAGGDHEEDTLEAYFARIRTTASTKDSPRFIIPSTSAPTLPTPNYQERQERRENREDPRDIFSGSRFSAFIKWEKKEAAVEEETRSFPDIFQNASPRTSYSQEERDVRKTHKAVKKRVETAALLAKQVLAKDPPPSAMVRDPSTISLQGTSAALNAKRKKGREKQNEDSGDSSLDTDMLNNLDSEGNMSAIPRIVVTVQSKATGNCDPHSMAVADPSLANAGIEALPFTESHSLSGSLQLAGRGIAQCPSPVGNSDVAPGIAKDESTMTTGQKVPAKKASKLPFQEPRARVSALPRQRSGVHLAELELDGTKMRSGNAMQKSQSTSGVAKKGGRTEGETPIQLSKQQKQQVWKEFSSVPLSDGVQNAYAVLYPHMYATIPTTGTAAKPSSSRVMDTTAVSADANSSDAPQVAQSQHKRTPVPLKEEAIQKHASALRLHSIFGLRQDPKQNSLQQDKKFWSAVEGYKAVGASSSILIMDAQTLKTRRKEIAGRIYEEFLSERSHQRLEWIDMYPEEVRLVTANMNAAPKHLFNMLQQTAQLRISTVISQRQMS